MGFVDKAKQLAEQAQQKLDEAQKNLSQSASPEAQAGDGPVRYDEHGRPIPEAPPTGEAAAPGDPGPPPPQPEGGGRANASPDPFKPLER
jgi:hypothetical protein